MAETETPFTIARRWNDFLECPQGTARSTAIARAKSFLRIAQKILVSNHPRNIDRESVPIREFFAADVESIERICAFGAVFEECSFSAGYESGKPMTSDSASFSLFLLNPFLPRLTPAA